MAFDMMNNSPSSAVSTMRSDFDLPNAANSFPYKGNPYSSFPASRTPQSNLTIAEQAELEYELRYRGNMIVDQQRKIQQLEDELRLARDQVEIMNNQLSSYEQDRSKEKKKPQSRYWTPEEHQRFLEALQKYGHKDVKSISMHVGTRNATQVRTHAQKYFLRLERERRKKEETHHDGYNSGSSLDDGLSPEHHSSDEGLSSVSISSLTLPGSPAVSMMSDSVGTPPGTPGDGSASSAGPGSPANGASPIIPPRRRATSFITVAQARLAAQHRDSVLVGLPPTWTVEDYDQFMKGLLTLADKHDDVSNLCRSIREQYLSHHTPEEVELCYRNVLKNLKQKPLVGSPKRRRTNSRPEPLTSPLIVSSFPASSLSLSSPFPFRPNSAPLQSYSSSPPTQSSPLVQGSTQQQHLNNNHMRHTTTTSFSEYGQLSSGLELPILSDINMGGAMLSPNPQQLHQQQAQQQQQQQQHQQQPQHSPLTSLSPALTSPLNSTVPITPSSLWGSALPFSFDALMSGSVGLNPPIPLASHN